MEYNKKQRQWLRWMREKEKGKKKKKTGRTVKKQFLGGPPHFP